MKKLFSLCIITMLILFVTNAQANIRRVGYFGTAVNNVDYTDLQSAHDASAAGDSILIFPGNWNCNVSKKIVMLSTGYFVDTASLHTQANAGLQNINASVIVSISLFAGSDNSVFDGLDGISIVAYYNNAVNNITIRRCHGSVYFNDQTSNNWKILQCYLDQMQYYWGGGTVTNLTVNNSYIAGMYLAAGAGTGQAGQFNNCIFGLNNYDFGNGSFIIKNSVFLGGHSNDANCVYQNNIFNSDYAAGSNNNGNKNVDNTTMTSAVFVGYSDQSTYSNDGRWALKAGSVAKGAGAGGTDCGIFGGTNPYKLSGIPEIPAFYKLTAPSNVASSNPYTITFSVRSNN